MGLDNYIDRKLAKESASFRAHTLCALSNTRRSSLNGGPPNSRPRMRHRKRVLVQSAAHSAIAFTTPVSQEQRRAGGQFVCFILFCQGSAPPRPCAVQNRHALQLLRAVRGREPCVQALASQFKQYSCTRSRTQR